MNKQFIISILSFAPLFMAQAQTMLSLEDCRRLALENNAKVHVAEGNRQAATEVSREAFTKYFPNIGANWLGFRSNKCVVQYTLPSIGQMLPPGAESLLPPEMAGLANQSLGEIELVKKGWTGSVYAIQPIFMGGQIINGNKLAHVGEEVASLHKENAEDEVIVTTEKYYWQIVTLQSKKQTLQSLLNMVDTLQYQVDVAVKAGVAMPNDLLKVKLQHNEFSAMMVDIDNGITLASNLLAQYIGLNGDSISVEPVNTVEQMPEYPDAVFVEPSQALSSTADYRLLQQNVKAADIKTRLAVGENLPKVGLGAGWMYDDLINEKHNFAAVMLTVSVPITDWWGGSHKIKKAKIEAQNARIQQEDLSQMLILKMQNGWDGLTAAYRKLKIAHEAIGESTENLRLNENYYRAGVSTITDLLDAQTLYRQTLDRYTEAFGSYKVATAEYLQSIGQLK